MRKLFVLLFICQFSFAQQDAWVYFSDKPEADFYLANPLEMLSQRALDRRTNQNIALDLLDVPIHQPYVDQVNNTSGITVLATSKWLNAVHVRGFTFSISNLGNLPFVSQIEFADQSLNARADSDITFVQHRTSEITVDLPYGNSANQIQMLNGHQLHEQDYTGAGKWIAVMDAGFPQVDVAQPFQRLWDNNLILGGYNFVDRNDNIFTRNNHGTMVLSTMGGYTPNELVGTAPDASYYLFITEDSNSENPVEESYWVEALEMADSLGVDIVNTSLGYFSFDNPNYNYSYSDLDGETAFSSRGAAVAFTRGMVLVVSAGNSGASSNPYISVPADADNVLAVGAVTPQENYASFSSIGPTPDGRIKPDVVAQGQSAVIATASGAISAANGTSFAGPIIAGMVASLWQAAPDKTNIEIMQMIKESAHLYNNPTPQLGYGIPDFAEALNLLSVQSFSENSFVIYPNPAATSFSVALPAGISESDITVQLFDIYGQMIQIQSGSTMEVEHLPSGVYFYRINSETMATTGKLIKK